MFGFSSGDTILMVTESPAKVSAHVYTSVASPGVVVSVVPVCDHSHSKDTGVSTS